MFNMMFRQDLQVPAKAKAGSCGDGGRIMGVPTQLTNIIAKTSGGSFLWGARAVL
jgi:hypothetical protein